MITKGVNHPRLASFFLRLGIGTAFLYAGIAAFLAPESWVGYFPGWLLTFLPGQILLLFFSLYQIALALWLFSGYKTFPAAVLASLTLAAITITNIYLLDIVFRDIAILCAAIGLAVIEKK